MSDRVDLSVSGQTSARAAGALEALLSAPLEPGDTPPARTRIGGTVVGTLVALRGDCEPLVVYPGQPGTAALAARTTLDLHGQHIGSEVVLMFEEADPTCPIVMGVVRKPSARALAERPGQIEVDADDNRLVVSAKDQIVLKCGKASITLTSSGKVLIVGAFVLHRSSGVLRIKGGSVQIN